MITCPSCYRVHEDHPDFCQCGEYLKWEGRGQEGAPPPGETTVMGAPADGTPEPVIRGDAVVLSLHAREQDPSGPIGLTVAPGGRTTLIARIRNQSGIVDNYDLALEGLPDGWWSIVPRTVYLLPLGTEGSYEGEAEIAIHPPLSPDAEAGEWTFEVIAFSRAYGQDVARAAAGVMIEPYSRLELAVRPQRTRGRRRGRVAVAIQNRGNAMSDLRLSAVDEEELLRFDIPREHLGLTRGEGVVDTVDIRPHRPLIIGRPIDRRFEVVARSYGPDEEPVTGAATFVQRPYLPWWLAIVVPLLIAALVVLWALLPNHVNVPDLTETRSVLQAQNELQKVGLELNPDIQRRRTDKFSPGRVIAQSPPPDTEIEEGKAVTIAVAVGSGRAEVPDVVEMEAAEAEAALTEAGFTVGATDPRFDPEFVVEAQIPEAGEMRATGSPVNLFLGPPPDKDGEEGGENGAGAPGAGAPGGNGEGAAGEGSGELTVPKIVGSSLAGATRKLQAAGLRRGDVRRVIDRESRGTVVGSDPEPGDPAEPGQRVDIVVSAGFPRLALGDGRRVLTVAGATGGAARAVADDVASRQPAWTPDGARLAYVAAGRIFLIDPTSDDSVPAPLTPAGGDNFASPSFAPATARRVMAFLRGRGGDGDLCFARIRGRDATRPACISDGRVDLNGRPVWSPRGTEILVPGVVPGTDGRRFGLVRYRSATPFSTRPSDWGSGRMVTDLGRAGRGVIGAGFSPDGERLAMVTNLIGSSFRLVIAKADDYLLRDAEVLSLPACGLAWRPDGRELAVVIADPQCTNRTGVLVRVNPDRPARLTAIRLLAASPDWQPVDLGG